MKIIAKFSRQGFLLYENLQKKTILINSVFFCHQVSVYARVYAYISYVPSEM